MDFNNIFSNDVEYNFFDTDVYNFMDISMDESMEIALNEMNDFLNGYKCLKPYSCNEFINNFPKYIFFKEKMEIFRFFLNKKYSFHTINWIVYNQNYLCKIINNVNFNDFLELLYIKHKENIFFYSEEDIFLFITDPKYHFFENILNCNKFYEEIEIKEEDKLNIPILQNIKLEEND